MIVNCELFIIPGSAANKINTCTWDMLLKSHNDQVESLGMPNDFLAREDDILVSVWFTSKEIDNWGCHGTPIDALGDRYMLRNLTLRFLSDVEEGTTIEMPILSGFHTVVAKASQLNHKYAYKGTFQNTIKEMEEYMKKKI